MVKALSKFLYDETGATAIEYGLMGALIAVALIVGATATGDSIENLFTGVDSEISDALD